MLALVDANYKFIYVDLGAAGRVGDAGFYVDSLLKESLRRNSSDFPESINLSGIPTQIFYHMVGDDAFPLSLSIMKPYPYRNLSNDNDVVFVSSFTAALW